MPDKPSHTVELLVRLAFTPKALTAIAVLAVTVLTVVFKFDVDWTALMRALSLFSAVFLIGIAVNLSPVPTEPALVGSPEVVFYQYGWTGENFPERMKHA